MQQLELGEDVRHTVTGEIGTIESINTEKPFPYLVRIEGRKGLLRSIRYEAFRADELERHNPAKPPPPRFSASGWKPKMAIVDEHAPPPAEDGESVDLAAIKDRLDALARAIERRPTGWQLFWIGIIALFALSAAMEIAGGWS